MDQTNNYLEHIKECYQDTFFSTQVSSRSPLIQQSNTGQKNIFRISNKLKDNPRVYYKKMKQLKLQAEQNHLQMLSKNVRARSQLQQLERDASVCKSEFMKLYQNKKFKLLQIERINESRLENQQKFRSSQQSFKSQKMYRELSLSLQKEKRQRDQQVLHETSRYNHNTFRQTLKENDERIRKIISQNREKVKQHHMELAEARKKRQELSLTRSKFNYMSKINEEMKLILEYQDQLQESQIGTIIDHDFPTAVPIKYPKIS